MNATQEQTNRTHYEVVVIGAGQAGLAIGYLLAGQRRRFTILEAAHSVGVAWRERWDSLVLFTPRRYDALPGSAFPGDPDGYPTRDEVIAYLDRYAETFELPVDLVSRVRSLTVEDGRLAIETMAEILDGKEVKARLPIPLTVVTKANVETVEPAF